MVKFIITNVAHPQDEKHIFSLLSSKWLTDREAAKQLSDIIVKHMHIMVRNNPELLYSYSIEVVSHQTSAFTEEVIREVTVSSTPAKRMTLKQWFYYWLSDMYVKGITK